MLVQVVLSLLACWSGAHAMYILEEAPQLFEDFIHKYEKTYATEAEKQHRFNVFVQNLEYINLRNEQFQRDVYGITKFSDLTAEEFKEMVSCLKPSSEAAACRQENVESLMSGDVPDSFDWRSRNAVSVVKDQGECRSCYAFSVAGNIEGQHAIKHNELYSLSAQQVVDCSPGNTQCGGGWPATSMQDIADEGGIELDSDYPYIGNNQSCQLNKDKIKARVTDCITYNPSSQEQLKQILYKQGPLSICIDDTDLQHYQPGHVITNCQSGPVNHAVLLVGYGTDNSGIPYWLVKNSWGTGWGDEGYFKVERGEGKSSCGLVNEHTATVIVA